VFQNLFSNAVKYRDPARPLRVSADASRRGQAVHVTVTDNGRGFDPADSQALFEPFRRFGQPASGSVDGLGLGLAICSRIVEGHGGSIEAAPLSPGAQFRIALLDPESDDASAPPVFTGGHGA
jgi:signal transduction histidine kinase